jgi:ATP phosphoribosyltransferase
MAMVLMASSMMLLANQQAINRLNKRLINKLIKRLKTRVKSTT